MFCLTGRRRLGGTRYLTYAARPELHIDIDGSVGDQMLEVVAIGVRESDRRRFRYCVNSSEGICKLPVVEFAGALADINKCSGLLYWAI